MKTLTQIDSTRVANIKPLCKPQDLLVQHPVADSMAAFVDSSRQVLSTIINGQSDRLCVIVGPCSIHDSEAALAYAEKLTQIKTSLSGQLQIVMRVYFEKPRTTVGWKGFINDPCLDGTYQVNTGLNRARELLLAINSMRLPAATEFLDTMTPQFIADLITWSAIGARTTESPMHRQLASGLSMPVGFKNGTTGNSQIAVDAISAAKNAHQFFGITKQGEAAIVTSTGNADCHIILRGGQSGTNYDSVSIAHTLDLLNQANNTPVVMVDCSHGNSNKSHEKQIQVIGEVSKQIAEGNAAIMGVMIESNLVAGKQSLDSQPLTYGQSVTDACIGWSDTEKVLHQLAEAVEKRRAIT